MIVCVCKGVSDRDVQAAIERGSSTIRDVGRCCQAGTDCGMCVNALRQMLQRRQRSHQGQKGI